MPEPWTVYSVQMETAYYSLYETSRSTLESAIQVITDKAALQRSLGQQPPLMYLVRGPRDTTPPTVVEVVPIFAEIPHYSGGP